MHQNSYILSIILGKQCWGVGNDILRDFEGTEDECKAKCKELNCVGFVRVNYGSKYAGKCYFRGAGIEDPIDYTLDNRDCYKTSVYNKVEGNQCTGTATDVLRDFEGDAKDCAFECDSRDDCVGFIRVNSGSIYADKCYLRGGTLNKPYPFNGDDRDCYQPVTGKQTNNNI